MQNNSMETVDNSFYEGNAAGVTDPATMSELRGSYSPLRPGSTLIAYQPNGYNNPKTPKVGKSQHLAQVRSLGLLHDLQEYISSVESMAADQKRELEKVREEKRDMEKFLARTEAANAERGVLDFMGSEVADLPPRMRALVEDNRGLREILKRYKSRTQSLESQVTAQHSHVLALAEANERLKQSLAECSRTPADVEREEALKKQLELKTRQLENLEYSNSVLRAKLDTDSRLYRQNLAAAAREKDALKRQLVAAKQAAEERDKEMRALNVELRKTRRGVPPTRQSVMAGTYHLPGCATEPPLGDEDAEGEAAAAAGAADASLEPSAPAAPLEEASLALPPLPSAGSQASAGAPASCEPEERIRIMLIIVRDEIIVHVPVPAAAAPVVVVEEPAAPAAVAEPSPVLQVEVEPQAPEPQPEPESAPEPSADPGPEPEPAAAAAAEPPEPEPAAEPTLDPVQYASAAEPESGGEPQAEPSVLGMVEEPDMVAAGAWSTSPRGARFEGVEAEGEGAPEQEAAEQQEAAEAGGSGGGGGAGPHSHSSQPLPVPYSRTNARALAARVGGASTVNRHPHPPSHGAAGAGAGGGAHRKASNASSTGGAAAAGAGGGAGNGHGNGHGSGKGPALKGFGTTSRRQL